MVGRSINSPGAKNRPLGSVPQCSRVCIGEAVNRRVGANLPGLRAIHLIKVDGNTPESVPLLRIVIFETSFSLSSDDPEQPMAPQIERVAHFVFVPVDIIDTLDTTRSVAQDHLCHCVWYA